MRAAADCRAAMTDDTLADLRAILELKHTYCSLVDRGATDKLFALFTADATIGYGDGRDAEYAGPDEVREWCATVPRADRSAHLAVCPRVDIVGDDAEGHWKYSVFLDWGDDIELGVGEYHETYRRANGGWRIASRIADRTLTMSLGEPVEPR